MPLIEAEDAAGAKAPGEDDQRAVGKTERLVAEAGIEAHQLGVLPYGEADDLVALGGKVGEEGVAGGVAGRAALNPLASLGVAARPAGDRDAAWRVG